MDKTWILIILGALGFFLTWGLNTFQAGRSVENMRSALKEELDEKLDEELGKLQGSFADHIKTQEHRFGEVGAALREKISQVENHLREVEIWGRDHYVQKEDMKAMVDQMREDFKEAVGEIKADFRRYLDKSLQ